MTRKKGKIKIKILASEDRVFFLKIGVKSISFLQTSWEVDVVYPLILNSTAQF